MSAALGGDRTALARLISLVENDRPGRSADLLGQVFARTGGARLLGLTGPPGVGKSTLVNRLIGAVRAEGLSCGVVAVDPTSPFSGGAILGDRVRMQEWATDRDVFIRSLATRGHLGGLSRAARDVVRLIDAAGFDVVLVETVGTGQAEVEVMELAHTVMVVLAPGLGDDVQAQKAGILEIADVLVVNKADRDGADQVVAQLNAMLDLAATGGRWRPPVIRTTAAAGDGVAELLAACDRHRAWLADQGRFEERLRRRTERELVSLVGGLAVDGALGRARRSGQWEEVVRAVAERRLDPYQAARQLLVGESTS